MTTRPGGGGAAATETPTRPAPTRQRALGSSASRVLGFVAVGEDEATAMEAWRPIEMCARQKGSSSEKEASRRGERGGGEAEPYISLGSGSIALAAASLLPLRLRAAGLLFTCRAPLLPCSDVWFVCRCG